MANIVADVLLLQHAGPLAAAVRRNPAGGLAGGVVLSGLLEEDVVRVAHVFTGLLGGPPVVTRRGEWRCLTFAPSTMANSRRNPMPLITLRDVRVRFRGPPLLDDVSCHIEAGQRIGLLGRNGAGKTTLMRLVAGDLKPDSGEVLLAPGTRVAMLRQDVPQDVGGTIADVVATGLDAEALAATVRRRA